MRILNTEIQKIETVTFWCDSLDVCIIKGIVTFVTFVFVILYLIAVWRVRKQKRLDLDVKDKILLYIVLGESILILLRFAFYNEFIFLFILRIAKMLEQVTICFILLELTIKNWSLQRAFNYSLIGCGVAVVAVLCVLIYKGNSQFLNEQRSFWVILSGFQVFISFATLLLGMKLMCQDPSWNANKNSENPQFKGNFLSKKKKQKKVETNLLDISLDSNAQVKPENRISMAGYNDATPKALIQDVKYQFGKVYHEELVKRRRKLFGLMLTSFFSVVVMFFNDFWMHSFFNKFNTLETVVTIIGRLIQYHAVSLFIYYIIYWPYRRNFQPKGHATFDVSFYSGQGDEKDHELSLIRKRDSIVPGKQFQMNTGLQLPKFGGDIGDDLEFKQEKPNTLNQQQVLHIQKKKTVFNKQRAELETSYG